MKPAFDWLLLAFGAALAFVGVYWMWSGWDIVQVERGWVSVISGAIMLSGGVMVAALAYGVMSMRNVMAPPLREFYDDEMRAPWRAGAARAEEPARERLPVHESLPAHDGQPAPKADGLHGLATPAVVAAAAAAGVVASARAAHTAHEGEAKGPEAQARTFDESDEADLDEKFGDAAKPAVQSLDEALRADLNDRDLDDLDLSLSSDDDARAAIAPLEPPAEHAPTEHTPAALAPSAEDDSGAFGRWFRRKTRPAAPEAPAIEDARENETTEARDPASTQDHLAQAEPFSARQADVAPPADLDQPSHFDDMLSQVAPAQAAIEQAAREIDAELSRALNRAEVAPPAPEPSPPPKAEPAILGRHSSGDTTYTMFADGSIEAETPEGIMRFDSLIELRRHVEKNAT